MTAAGAAIGANAADREPRTFAHPARASDQSSGSIATGNPARRSRSPRCRAIDATGAARRIGPSAAAASSSGYGSTAGASRTVATEHASASLAKSCTSLEVTGCGGGVRTGERGRPRTTEGGDAVRNSAAGRPAQRHEAHSARSKSSGGGPHPLTFEIDCNVTPIGGTTRSSTTQPPTRRP